MFLNGCLDGVTCFINGVTFHELYLTLSNIESNYNIYFTYETNYYKWNFGP